MSEEEKKKMKELEDFKAAAEPKLKDLDEATKTIDKLEKSVKDKDLIIEQKNKDIVGARKETQALKELTEEDKKKMSAKEIELHDASLALQQRMEQFETDQKEAAKKEIGARQEAIIKKMSGGREDVAKAMRDNFNKLDPALRDKATTEEEITPLMNSAYEMLGALKPNAISTNIGGEGGGAPGESGGDKDSFATTDAGKEILKNMGLPTEDAKPVATPPANL